MHYRHVALAGVSALALAATSTAFAAQSKTSHALLFENQARTVDCGVEIPLPHKKPSLVLCVAAGIPRPKGPVGDPFVQIGKKGKPKVVLVSQNEFETSKATKLGAGATWTNLGVSCKVTGKPVTCTNASKHGFTIGNGKYKSF